MAVTVLLIFGATASSASATIVSDHSIQIVSTLSWPELQFLDRDDP